MFWKILAKYGYDLWGQLVSYDNDMNIEINNKIKIFALLKQMITLQFCKENNSVLMFRPIDLRILNDYHILRSS